MKRSTVQFLWRGMLTAVTLCLAVGATAEESVLGERFVAGTHYEVLEIAVDTRDSDKVEVVEMFSYACIHCFNFDPYVKAWHARQPDNVDFHAVPAIFNDDWERLAQAFYTSESLGVTEKVHERMFEGIHNLNEDLRQAEILAPIFEELAEVNESDFNAAHKSFSVRSRVQQAKALVRAYKITGVPTMIVNGKYRIDGRMAGGNAKMIEVVDFLVAKERQSQ
ncbi:MAG: thioredoxin domain-containing protein [Pseudomonadales bacterium]|nr:thioredoxin domain-containing protein [Pseudomonadales bacterium]